MTPRRTADVVAEAARAALGQVLIVTTAGTAVDTAAIARAIGNNAAQVIAEDPIGAIVTAVAMLGASASSVTVSSLPSGSRSVRICVASAPDVAALASDLGCAAPRRVTGDRHEWWVAELGDYGDPLMVTITGGQRDLCSCPEAVAARKAG